MTSSPSTEPSLLKSLGHAAAKLTVLVWMMLMGSAAVGVVKEGGEELVERADHGMSTESGVHL